LGWGKARARAEGKEKRGRGKSSAWWERPAVKIGDKD